MRDEYPRDLIESDVRGQDAEPGATVSMNAPETERLRLRQWLPRDFAPFAVLNADPRVAEHLPGPLSRAESDALALRLQALIEEQGWGFWAAEWSALSDRKLLDRAEASGFDLLTTTPIGCMRRFFARLGWPLKGHSARLGAGITTDLNLKHQRRAQKPAAVRRSPCA
jgi:hypothetical protein